MENAPAQHLQIVAIVSRTKKKTVRTLMQIVHTFSRNVNIFCVHFQRILFITLLTK